MLLSTSLLQTSRSQTGGMCWGKWWGGENIMQPRRQKGAGWACAYVCMCACLADMGTEVRNSGFCIVAFGKQLKQAMNIFFISHLTHEVSEQIQRKQTWGHDQLSKSKGVFLANVPSLTSLFLFSLLLTGFHPPLKLYVTPEWNNNWTSTIKTILALLTFTSQNKR